MGRRYHKNYPATMRRRYGIPRGQYSEGLGVVRGYQSILRPPAPAALWDFRLPAWAGKHRLWLDSGRTMRASEIGDPAGARDDLGPDGLHAVQTTDADRSMWLGLGDGVHFAGGGESLVALSTASAFSFLHETAVFSIGLSLRLAPVEQQNLDVPDIVTQSRGSDTTGVRTLWDSPDRAPRIIIRTDGGSDTDITGDADTLHEDTWHTLWFVGDGSTIRMYVDGDDVGSGAVAGTASGAASDDLHIFRRLNNGSSTAGDMRWLVIFDRALDQSEIEALS